MYVNAEGIESLVNQEEVTKSLRLYKLKCMLVHDNNHTNPIIDFIFCVPNTSCRILSISRGHIDSQRLLTENMPLWPLRVRDGMPFVIS